MFFKFYHFAAFCHFHHLSCNLYWGFFSAVDLHCFICELLYLLLEGLIDELLLCLSVELYLEMLPNIL